MEFPPFFRRPYYYYTGDKYANYPYAMKMRQAKQQTNKTEQNQPQTQMHKMQQDYANKQQTQTKQSQAHINTNTSSSTSTETRREQEDVLFEIFGIKLCFDDILIIALIFFLYNEGVRDNLLFISLILLLLS